MKIKELDAEVFDAFARNHPHHNFFQTSAMANRRKHDGWLPHYLGFYKDKELVGATVLTSTPYKFNKRMFQAQGAPLINFEEDTQEVFELLIKYLDEHETYHCLINPNVVKAIHIPEKDHVEYMDGVASMKQQIIDAGWTCIENADQDDDLMNWIYIKDISGYETLDALKDSFNASTKRKINNVLKTPLYIEDVGLDRVDEVMRLLQMTADREGFAIRDEDYFTTLYENFKDYSDIKYVLVMMDVKQFKETLTQEINDLDVEIDSYYDQEELSKKSKNLLKDCENQRTSRLQKLERLNEIKEDKVAINAGVFIIIDHEMIYLSGGSDDAYYSFNGLLYLQWEMMIYCLEHDIDVYNFYGTRGSFCGRPEEDGVYRFKRGFSGDLIEKIGYFTYQPKNLKNRLITVLKAIKDKIKN